MQKCNNLFKYGALPLLVASMLVSESAIAAKQETVQFTADISTKEFLLPAPLCSSGNGGVGTGFASTNLFTKKPLTEKTTVALALSDCVTMVSPSVTDFGPGAFTLTGPGGESIFAKYSGRLILDFTKYDPTSNLLTYQFDTSVTEFQIIGGTGRYANAKGFGTISGTEIIDLNTNTSVGKLFASGSITY